MKLPKDFGRKENMAAFILWIILSFVYYFAVSLLIRRFVFPGYAVITENMVENPAAIVIMVGSVILAFLTAHSLFGLYLRSKAYRVRTEPGMQAWRAKKKDEKNPVSEAEDVSADIEKEPARS
ncbi:MAG: hypothetical protein Q4D81_09960 [Eubacteriales bacterium]|nr:hypothetical protein [Eubacteriales bacterium]